MKSIYAYVHKHHHHQKAPSRANIDAVNVHPLEFFLGEFNHILALHLVVKGTPLLGFSGMDVSWAGAVAFIGLGGVLAGLNHTRHDVVARVPSGGLNKTGWTVFDSKHHDVHHRIPQSNYGQYTVMWDRIFGTFRYVDMPNASFCFKTARSLIFLMYNCFSYPTECYFLFDIKPESMIKMIALTRSINLILQLERQ